MGQGTQDKILESIESLVRAAREVSASKGISFDLGRMSVSQRALDQLGQAVGIIETLGDTPPSKIERIKLLFESMTTDEILEAIGVSLTTEQLDRLAQDLDGPLSEGVRE